MSALPAEKYFTYSDYMTWDDDVRRELIDGLPYAMSAPVWRHQAIGEAISRKLGNFLDGKPCRVFNAPLDVRLNADTADDTVVQPDIMVICDQKKLEDPRGCKGAPEMVVEVVSPSTAKMDRIIKYRKYQEAGVIEYWIVDPEYRTVEVHLLENGKYVKYVYADDETIPVHILEGCLINLAEVFAGI